jgi:hypothetical protein
MQNDPASPTQLEHQRLLRLINDQAKKIKSHFRGRSLATVASTLRDTVERAPATCDHIVRARPVIRGSVGILVVLMVMALFYQMNQLEFAETDGWTVVEGIEAGINTLVYMGLAIVFLVSLEFRSRRQEAFKALQELRALAHVLDMHQMNKDPFLLKSNKDGPSDELTPRELIRYLDDTSDLLSILAKLAAWYAQRINDAEVLAAVNEIEQLTTALSQKIGQKIQLVSQQCPEAFFVDASGQSRTAPDV